ncbi:hypothetical protein Tco_1119906, partial [Tanacetum coccineum]
MLPPMKPRTITEKASTDLRKILLGTTIRKRKNRDGFSLYCGSNHRILSNLSKSPMEILATEKHQIEEAVKSGQLAHLVKGIKKGKAKVSDTQL